MFGIVYVFHRSEFSWFSWESRVCEWHVCPKDRCFHRLALTLTLTLAVGWKYFVVLLIIAKQSNDICPWNGRILRTYSVCIYIMSPIWGAHSAAHIRLQCCFVPYKTFSRYKTLYGIHLVSSKTFLQNKLPEGCPLWPAAYEVERIAPAWRTSPHGPTGRRTGDPSFPYHMFDV